MGTLHVFRSGRWPISVALLTVFVVTLVWYVGSGFTNLPGMLASGSLLLLLVLYGAWRERDLKSARAEVGGERRQ